MGILSVCRIWEIHHGLPVGSPGMCARPGHGGRIRGPSVAPAPICHYASPMSDAAALVHLELMDWRTACGRPLGVLAATTLPSLVTCGVCIREIAFDLPTRPEPSEIPLPAGPDYPLSLDLRTSGKDQVAPEVP